MRRPSAHYENGRYLYYNVLMGAYELQKYGLEPVVVFGAVRTFERRKGLLSIPRQPDPEMVRPPLELAPARL